MFWSVSGVDRLGAEVELLCCVLVDGGIVGGLVIEWHLDLVTRFGYGTILKVLNL